MMMRTLLEKWRELDLQVSLRICLRNANCKSEELFPFEKMIIPRYCMIHI